MLANHRSRCSRAQSADPPAQIVHRAQRDATTDPAIRAALDAAIAALEHSAARDITTAGGDYAEGAIDLAVVGAPGSGKTTLLHYTVVRLAEVLAADNGEHLAVAVICYNNYVLPEDRAALYSALLCSPGGFVRAFFEYSTGALGVFLRADDGNIGGIDHDGIVGEIGFGQVLQNRIGHFRDDQRFQANIAAFSKLDTADAVGSGARHITQGIAACSERHDVIDQAILQDALGNNRYQFDGCLFHYRHTSQHKDGSSAYPNDSAGDSVMVAVLIEI
jgi:hypothetical protein